MEKKEILYVDLSGLDRKVYHEKFAEIRVNLQSEEGHLLILFNLEGTFLSWDFKLELDKVISEFKHKIDNAALMGAGSSVKKLILQSINFPLYFSDDQRDCEEWLSGL